MVNSIFSALLQVILFTAIPFIVFLIKTRGYRGFLDYVGLKRSNTKANLLALLLMIVLASPTLLIAVIDDSFLEVLHDPKSVTGSLRTMGFGFEGVVILLLIAIVKTGLSEEIFFRGFVAKRLIALTNFRTGNAIHAILFGAIHTLLFLSVTDHIGFLILIGVVPTIGAFIKVYLNEKLADGSIIPGWIAHASANSLAYSLIAFVW